MLLLCVCSAEKRNSYKCGTTWRSVNNDLFEGIVCPKNKIVIIYSHSRRSEPVRRFSSVECGRYFEECLESNQSPLTWITVQYSTWKYNRKSTGNKKRFSHHAAFEERNAWHKWWHHHSSFIRLHVVPNLFDVFEHKLRALKICEKIRRRSLWAKVDVWRHLIKMLFSSLTGLEENINRTHFMVLYSHLWSILLFIWTDKAEMFRSRAGLEALKERLV